MKILFSPPLSFCSLLSLALATLLSAPVLANGQQTGAVAGRVTDRVAGQPIPGATVQLVATNRLTTVDELGRYEFSDVSTGRVELSVTVLGYKSQIRAVTVEAGTAAELNFHMTATPVSLDRILVTAVGPKRSREVANAVTSIDAAPIAI